jgi:uncharacterized protein involved in response to NO
MGSAFRLYGIGAATCLGLAAASKVSAIFAGSAAGALGTFARLDALHLGAVGGGGLAAGAFFVRAFPVLTPDPNLRKGIAPRAFWLLFVAAILRALSGGVTDPQRFASALSMACLLTEGSAAAMLLYGAFGARAAEVAPEAPATPAPVSALEAKSD